MSRKYIFATTSICLEHQIRSRSVRTTVWRVHNKMEQPKCLKRNSIGSERTQILSQTTNWNSMMNTIPMLRQ